MRKLTPTEQINDCLCEAYDLWLMEFCSDEIHNKDQLIIAHENAHRIDDFYKYIKGADF